MITKSITILDKSGSMSSARAGTIKGFNELIQQIKLDSKDGKEIKASLVTFNGSVFENFWNISADELHEITEEDYVPEGGTAMRDAIGYVCQKLLDEKAEDGPDVRYEITVITDGETNSDRKYSTEAIKEFIESGKRAGNWTFSWIGCSESSALEMARTYAVPVGSMASYTTGSNIGAEAAFKGLRERRSAFYSSDLAATCCMMSDSGTVADFTVKTESVGASAGVTTTSASTVIDWAKDQKKKK